MQQITINVENPSIMPSLRRVLNAIEGISIVPARRKTGIEEAEDDIRKGRVYKAVSVDDMFKQILDYMEGYHQLDFKSNKTCHRNF